MNKGVSDKLLYQPEKFVDREKALYLVLEKARRISAGVPVMRRVVIFHGQRGAGKTWLLQELKRRLASLVTPHLVFLGKGATPGAIAAGIPSQRPLALLVGDVNEADGVQLEALEEQVLAPLLQDQQVLIVLAERGRPHVWTTPDLREKSEDHDLEAFQPADVADQIKRQVPGTGADATEINAVSGGYPWSNYLLARYHPQQEEALARCIELLLEGLNGDLRTYLEALCVLRAFDETRMVPVFQAYSPEFAEQHWDYAVCRGVRQDLLDTTLVCWQAEARGYVVDEPLRLVLEAGLRARDFERWFELHCTCFWLYAGWAERYEQASAWWVPEAQYHAARLQAVGRSPRDCSHAREIDPGLLSLLLGEGLEPKVPKEAEPEIPEPEAAPQIFLSYARKDQVIVEELYDQLSAAGFKPWMDVRNLLPGEDWLRAIRKAIQASTFFLACLSTNSVERRGIIREEIRTALETWQRMLPGDIYLIPVRLEECHAPEDLAVFHWVDWFRPGGFERLVEAIHEGMRRRG